MNYIYFYWVVFLLRLIYCFQCKFLPLVIFDLLHLQIILPCLWNLAQNILLGFFFALFPPKTLKLKLSPRLNFAHWRCDKLLKMQYRLSFLNRSSSSCARNLIKSHFYTCITTARWSSIGGLASNTWPVASVSGLWFCQRKEEWNTFT